MGNATQITGTVVVDSGGISEIIKYNKNDEVEWLKTIKTEEYAGVQSINITNDGGYIIGGCVIGTNTKVEIEDYKMVSTKDGDGIALKLKNNGKVEKIWKLENGKKINTVIQMEDGQYKREEHLIIK